MIGDNIKIMVIRVKGEIVRLGIECDPSIPIHRMEVYERIQREKSCDDETNQAG